MSQSYSAETPSQYLPIEVTGKKAYVFPTSSGQRRLWFLDQLKPGTSAYNLPIALRIEGPLDEGALQKALQEIVSRHEILRTTFDQIENDPIQIVSPSFEFKLKRVDLSLFPAAQRESKANSLIEEEVQRAFDLRRGPLFRVTLYALAMNEHLLLLNMHHIVSDGWSFSVILRELGTYYESFSTGKEPELGELPIQYADYAQWQQEYLSTADFRTKLDFWKEALAEAPQSLDLPIAKPRPRILSLKASTASLLLSEPLIRAVTELSRRQGTTLFMTLMAAFKILLHRYTNQQDIVVGSPVANRNLPEVEDLVGFLVNTLLFRTKLSGELSFNEVLSRVREGCLRAYAYQDVPFEKIVEEFNPDRKLNRNPFFQTLFIYQKAFIQPIRIQGISFTPFRIDRKGTQTDLTFFLVEREEGMRLSCEYSTDLFDAPSINRLLAHYQTLLQSIVTKPQAAISELSLLPEAERSQILIEWNQTKAEYPGKKVLHELIEEQVTRTPEATAVTFENNHLSYSELNSKANQLGHYLKKFGVTPNLPVYVCMERSFELVTALLAVLKAGGAYVPLDPEYPEQRLAFMLEDVKSPVVITEERFLNRFSTLTSKIVCLELDSEKIHAEPANNLQTGVQEEDLAYVIYTSGSTGKPKGAMNTHAGISNRLLWMQDEYQLNGSDRVLQKTPYSFDVSVWEFFSPLMTGARLVLAKPGGHRDPEYLATLIQNEQITTTHFVPSMLRLFLDVKDLARCASLQRVICSGEALSIDLVERFHANLGADLHNLYGPTEASVEVTHWACDRHGSKRPTVPIGRPIANTEIYILDANLNPVPVGIPGELHIGGVGLARGYLNRDDLTIEKFIKNPFSKERTERLYKTGDIARFLDDGNIEYLGRVDHQVKIRGMRVELGEIEAALKEVAAVRSAIVTMRHDQVGDQRLVAYVIASENETSARELKLHLERKLPAYMIPSAFVLMDSFPHTVAGKIDLLSLPIRDVDASCEQEFVAPRNVLEQKLVDIWEKTLKIHPISVKDSFFDLGGHSLLAVSLFSEIAAVTGKQLPLATLFDAPTVEGIASILQQESSGASCLVPINSEGSKLPLFCVHAGGGNVLFYRDLARHLGPDRPFYGVQPRGLNGKQERHFRIEDMAAYYLEEIKKVYPSGPYNVGGSSFGGLVAFEMAKQLQEQGDSVGLVALFDTYAPGYLKRHLRTSAGRIKLAFLVDRIVHHVETIRILSPGKKWSYIKVKATKAKNQFRRFRKRSRRRVTAQLLKSLGRPLPEHLRETQSSIKIAAAAYQPKTYPGVVTLFRASRQPSGIHPDTTLGWGELVTGHLEIHEVHGSHGTIIVEPRVGFLVDKLNACLEVHDMS